MQSHSVPTELSSETPRFDFSENVYGLMSLLTDSGGTDYNDLLSLE